MFLGFHLFDVLMAAKNSVASFLVIEHKEITSF
jgi:hypothetical protein